MMDLTKRSWKRPGGPELTEDLLSLGHVSGRRLSLLDVGAGDGLAMEYLAEQHPDWSITGIDPERGVGPEGSIQKGYAENLPAEDNSFDLVRSGGCLNPAGGFSCRICIRIFRRKSFMGWICPMGPGA